MKELRRQQCLTRCMLGAILLASIGLALLPYLVESRLSDTPEPGAWPAGPATGWQLFATVSTICCSILGMVLLHRSNRLDRQGIRLAETRAVAGRDELFHAARHDALTGLGNRLLLRERFAEIEENVGRGADPAIMLFIDLDDFKRINDSSGHACGDAHLRIVADRIRGCVRANDTVTRIGGDEFVVLVAAARDSHAGTRIAEAIAERLGKPFTLLDTPTHLGCSIGMTGFPLRGDTLETALARADRSMYEAKRRKRDRGSRRTKDAAA
ncbi:MAG: GGDEF domain-containing protein [Geminicoccaceae bacterium]